LSSFTQLHDLPAKALVLLVGPPGSGKSTFCQQTVLHNLAADTPIIYVTTEAATYDVETTLRDHGLGTTQPALLSFVDAYTATVGIAVPDRADTVHADCNALSSIDIAISKLQQRIGRQGILLVFDSLTSPYLFTGTELIRFMRLTLSRFTAGGNTVIACMDEGCSKSEDLVALMSLANGVIKLTREGETQSIDIVKHPTLAPSRLDIPIEPEQLGIVKRVWNPQL
jgi:KaiC/GvpD/RAD55 family RecA-like ATPase